DLPEVWHGLGHRGQAGGQASGARRQTNSSPESGPPVSRAKRSERPLGENSAPTSIAGELTSGGSFTRGGQPAPSRRASYRSPPAMTTRRVPSGDGSASYSSPAVLIVGPRFSTCQAPSAPGRARQMSLPPSPPGRLEPKYSQPSGAGRGNQSVPGELTG